MKPNELAEKLAGVVLIMTALIVLVIDQIAVTQPPFWKEMDRTMIWFMIPCLISCGFSFEYPDIPPRAGVRPVFFTTRVKVATAFCALCLIAFSLFTIFGDEKTAEIFFFPMGFFIGPVATRFAQYVYTPRQSR